MFATARGSFGTLGVRFKEEEKQFQRHSWRGYRKM